jgi:hypothetical protein
VAKQIFDALDLNIAKQSDLYIAAPAEVLIYLGELLLENGGGFSYDSAPNKIFFSILLYRYWAVNLLR